MTLQQYEGFCDVQRLGEMWSLKQGRRTLVCTLSTHPLGWELRLAIGDSLSRSQVCRLQREVFDTGDSWKAEALNKGWAAASDGQEPVRVQAT